MEFYKAEIEDDNFEIIYAECEMEVYDLLEAEGHTVLSVERYEDASKRFCIRDIYRGKAYIRYATTPEAAIERLADQYGWGELHDVMYDADTRGEEWCKARVCWGGETGRILIAELA